MELKEILTAIFIFLSIVFCGAAYAGVKKAKEIEKEKKEFRKEMLKKKNK